MKTIIFGGTILLASVCYSQRETKSTATLAQTNDLIYFNIPAAINGSNIDPTPVSSISSDFTEKELALKIGFPFKDENLNFKNHQATNTWYLAASASASDGISTLWKPNKPSTEYGLSFGYNHIRPYMLWTFTTSGERATERMNWFSLKSNINWAKYNLFTPDNEFDNILFERRETNGYAYVSFNRYFFSTKRKFRWLSCIYSVGAGYAKTNNYSSLEDRTYQIGSKGKYNADTSMYQNVVETTDGKEGDFLVYEGFTAYGEAYFPLTNLDNQKISIYLGGQLTYFAIGSSRSIVNANTGFYFNIKNQQTDSKDIVSFSITGQFLDLGKQSPDYFENNFSVLMRAVVPLRFN
jgi:hypothetical protein